jgi:hypothetical protein
VLRERVENRCLQETPIHAIVKKLAGGDRRSIGRSNEVVEKVLAQPGLFRALVEGLSCGEYVVQMRAADAMEKITRQKPELLIHHKKKLLEMAARASEKELRWHMAMMLPRLRLNEGERAAAVDILHEYLKDSSSIVKTWAMQGLGEFACADRRLMARVRPMVEELTQIGTPAMRARGRKLLKEMTGAEPSKNRGMPRQ